MKLPYYLFIFFVAFCFPAAGQTWEWGRGNTGVGADGWAVATDPAGNVFGGGVTFGPADIIFGTITLPSVVGAAASSPSAVMVKYDPSGNAQWGVRTGGGAAWLINIAADKNGNSYMYGVMQDTSLSIGATVLTNTLFPRGEYFLAKFDAHGNILWAKSEGGGAPNALLGGISVALGAGGITCDDVGNVYITGSFNSASTTIGSTVLVNSDPAGYSYDMFVAKYTPTGSLVWAKSAGGVGTDNSLGIAVTHSGDVYIAGDFGAPTLTFGSTVITNTGSSSSGQTAFIARYDASGTPVWGAAAGGSGRNYAVGIASDLLDNVYLTGGFKESSISYSGHTIPNPRPNQASLYLVKFDPSNNVAWHKTIYAGDSLGTWGYCIAMSLCGIVWVSGVMNDSVIIDGHTLKSPPLGSPYAKDRLDPVFIAGYTSAGAYAGSAALASGGDDQNGIACDHQGNVFMCSDYGSAAKFVVGPDTLYGPDVTEYMYVAKYPYINVNGDFKHEYQLVCHAEPTKLNAPSGYQHYQWSGHVTQSGETNINYTNDTGVFWVYAFDSCAAGVVDTFKVRFTCGCDATLFVPNLFSPNGDGQNDVFYPRGGNDITEVKSFRIYDRWGELVFEKSHININDASQAWDGKYKGIEPRPEVYVWVAEVVCRDGKEIFRKGNVTVVR